MSNLYFAYGSNMDIDRMHSRCPSACEVGSAVLPGWEMRIGHRGFATISPRVGANTWGALWSVTDEDLDRLDGYEGVHHGVYHRQLLEVSLSGLGRLRPAEVYIEDFAGHGQAEPGYLRHLACGADYFDLPNSYRSMLTSLGR